ncbi:hypothetical protein ANCDUO_24725 [Ancylostoma duodenale]|uniref:Uncharacterized protein n=1 Tax=Ancylostoma duodenale TaxID=51022 RepID=A0A0C2BN22_9BILA|nr:hypothetical protein ANCDUO_24725 [Ancylostoma duodenale]
MCLNVGRRPSIPMGHSSKDSQLSFKNWKENKNAVNLSENFRLNLIQPKPTINLNMANNQRIDIYETTICGLSEVRNERQSGRA